MGCDIHAHFEIKVDGEWLHYSQPHIHRNYELFGKMAGVRGDEQPVSLAKGLPKDMSKTTILESIWLGADGHSHSWLNSKEIAEVIKFHESQTDPSIAYKVSHEHGWDSFEKYRDDYPEEIEDIRLVFWFDN